MPHCVIEYTNNLSAEVDINNMVDVAFETIVQAGLFNQTAIKARAISYDHYKSGLSKDDYIHITIRILPGRTPKQKSTLSALMLGNIGAITPNTTSISIEIVDLDGDCYEKRVLE
ncbi:MAG: 5-carboxymethyl-2-hydroxymuconate Delta-isomerase [Kordiimonadaceae bacterium]|jgi:5-carboxymethyl-2-hydroxymuconate isomerase|nr:5-carboxymethyl-2-hydroxymuconate Delta-isomerase [Kordiimonadaceae bacterium]MBT6032699.1 5-carboxymethyl-2-hydroxymuconate Delta-isomerase [Kordiimonadaceae bacterium]